VSKINVLSALLLRSPLVWGGALAFCFFALIHGGVITDANVIRYLAGHWVEYVETAMFCVGLAALVIKWIDVERQRRCVDDELLAPVPEGGQEPAEAAALVASLPVEGDATSGSYLVTRLREGLDLVVRTGSAEGLQDHLKYLSDLDAARAAQSYGLVRFVIWAVPIMGFLGTVIGITEAIAQLSPTQLENISGVVAGLGVAFDTTATALALSMVLMFMQFVIDRREQSLLGDVDGVAWVALAGRFQSLEGGDGTALAVARREDFVAHRGVYVAVTGPNLETRAEYRFLRGIGADIVGMSTVPEVIVAVHAGMRVLGISVVTDMCLPDALEVATVEKILAVARSAEPKLRAIITDAVRAAGGKGMGR